MDDWLLSAEGSSGEKLATARSMEVTGSGGKLVETTVATLCVLLSELGVFPSPRKDWTEPSRLSEEQNSIFVAAGARGLTPVAYGSGELLGSNIPYRST